MNIIRSSCIQSSILALRALPQSGALTGFTDTLNRLRLQGAPPEPMILGEQMSLLLSPRAAGRASGVDARGARLLQTPRRAAGSGSVRGHCHAPDSCLLRPRWRPARRSLSAVRLLLRPQCRRVSGPADKQALDQCRRPTPTAALYVCCCLPRRPTRRSLRMCGKAETSDVATACRCDAGGCGDR